MQRWLSNNRHHILASGLIVIMLTVFSVVWAASSTSSRLGSLRTAETVEPSETIAVLGESDDSDDDTAGEDASSGEQADEDSSAQSSVIQTENAKNSTAEDINQALESLNLAGWEDELLSDEELGL